jgi:1-phosphatidylinositol-4-phosphate 5-kinase
MPGILDETEFDVAMEADRLCLRRDSVLVSQASVATRITSDLQPVTLRSYDSHYFDELIEARRYVRIAESLQIEKNLDAVQSANDDAGGRSGEFFFYSDDGSLLIKSCSSTDREQLLRILPNYVHYLKQNPKSLLVPIFGLFEMVFPQIDQTLLVIVMQNINYKIPRDYVSAVYDLKGSRIHRQSFTEQEIQAAKQQKFKLSRVGKDLDFQVLEGTIQLSQDARQEILDQLKKDTAFLEENSIMDYSLMISKIKDDSRFRLLKKNEHSRAYMLTSEKPGNEGLTFCLGVIDYLQEYNLHKKLERIYKILRHCRTDAQVSVSPPDYYASRFMKEIAKLL